MSEKNRRFFDVRILVGLAIMLAGVLLLLSRLGMMQRIDVFDFWPVILILIGIGKIYQPKEYRQTIVGTAFIAIGSLFMLDKFGIMSFDWDDVWPLVLVFVGIAILKGAIFTPKHGRCRANDEEGEKEFGHAHFGKDRPVKSDTIHINAVLGGGGYRFDSKKLAGGKVSAVLGGCEINLTEAKMEGNRIELDLFALMGGIELRVPTDWRVINEITPILGGVDDDSVASSKATKELVLRGTAIMGGIDIKN